MGPTTADKLAVESSENTAGESLLLVLDEISHLVSQTQAPAATLCKVVALIQSNWTEKMEDRKIDVRPQPNIFLSSFLSESTKGLTPQMTRIETLCRYLVVAERRAG